MKLSVLLILTLLTSQVFGLSVYYPPAAVPIVQTKPGDKPELVSYKPIDYKSVAYMMERYETLQESNEALNGVAEIFGEVAHTVIDVADFGTLVGGAATGNFPLMLTGQLGAKGAHGVVNTVVKSFENHGLNQTKELLLNSLDATYKRVPNFDSLSKDDQYHELMKTAAFESANMATIIKYHENNAIFQTYMLTSMESELYKLAKEAHKDGRKLDQFQKALAKEGIEIKKLTAEAKAEIIDQVEKIGATVIAIDKKKYATQSDVLKTKQELLNGLKGLTDQLKSPSITLDDVNKNVNVVKAMMFTRLTVEEQKKQLDSGNCDDIFGANKANLQLRINFEVAANQVLSVANSATQIAAAMGVNPKVIAGVSKGIAVAQGAANLTVSIMSSNPMGMLSSAAGMVGLFGNQPDPAAERHKEIMEGISKLSQQIAEGNVQIRKDIAEVKDMLREINKNIIIIDKKISYIIQEIGVINARLNHIDNNIVELADVIIEMEFHHYKTCSKRIIETIRNTPSGKDLYNKLSRMSEYDRSQAIKGCVKGFDLLFAPDDQSPFFRTFSTYNETQIGIFKTNYKELLNLLRNDLTDVSVSKLIKPNSEYYALDSKLSARDLKRVGFTWSSMMNPVAPERVARAVDDYLTFYPVTYLFNQDRTGYCDLLPYAEREACKKEPGDAYRSLKEALALVQIAVAQQTAVYGDLVLYKIIDKMKTKDEDFIKGLEAVLTKNPMLAKNLMLVYISDWVHTHHPRDIWYRFGLETPQSRALDVLGLPWKLKYTKCGGNPCAYFEVHEYKDDKLARVYLPTEQEYYDGKLQTSPELPRLLQLRKRLVNAIVDIQTFNYIKESDERVQQAYLDLTE